MTARRLLAAAAGSTMVTMALTASFACGNLVAPPPCGQGRVCPDGGVDAGTTDGGNDDGGMGGDQ